MNKAQSCFLGQKTVLININNKHPAELWEGLHPSLQPFSENRGGLCVLVKRCMLRRCLGAEFTRCSSVPCSEVPRAITDPSADSSGGWIRHMTSPPVKSAPMAGSSTGVRSTWKEVQGSQPVIVISGLDSSRNSPNRRPARLPAALPLVTML